MPDGSFGIFSQTVIKVVNDVLADNINQYNTLNQLSIHFNYALL